MSQIGPEQTELLGSVNPEEADVAKRAVMRQYGTLRNWTAGVISRAWRPPAG
jgi:hypothetical protein